MSIQPMSAKIGFAQELDDLTLARAKRGDMQAFAEIYERYKRPCYTLALRILGNVAAAEDLVQDVFLKVLDRIGKFRGEAPFGLWLKRLTVNATVDQLRMRRWLPENALEEMAAAAPAAELACDAWTLLQMLPPPARAVLVLHEVEGYTHRELAEMFGHTESYSKSILARALKRLNILATVSAGELAPCAMRN